jgi:hypothetical protein
MYYLLLVVAWILGQSLYTAITVWRLQKGLEIDYFPALKAYAQKETGGYVVSFIFMLIVCFILPELLNLQMDKSELLSKEQRSWVETIQMYFRSACTLLGMFSLHVAYSVYKGGKKGIQEQAKKITGANIDDI